MVDNLLIKIKAGNGGDGAVAFERRKGRPYGPPVGGDGGDGGSVYIVASKDLYDLESLRYRKTLFAGDGERGGKNRKRGKDGDDLVVKVPLGTQVRIRKIGQNGQIGQIGRIGQMGEGKGSEMILDLVSDGERFLAADGGKGGMGNARLSVKLTRRLYGEERFEAFRKAEKGGFGQEAEIFLELKIIADIGIIGFPNVGKSSLLAVLTKAKPKVADYPFTTLEPNLGIADLSNWTDLSNLTRRIVLADVPGLISGASKGKGLGDRFLRHIERVRGLVHVLAVGEEDLSNLTNWSNPSTSLRAGLDLARKLWNGYNTVRNELRLYEKGEELLKKPEIVVLNKIDLLDKGVVATASKYFSKHKVRVIAVSARTGDGLGELVKAITGLVSLD